MIFTAHISKKGGVREQNQDRTNIWRNINNKKRKVYCLFVADGMGGHFGGDRASEIVEKEVKKQFLKTNFLDKSDSQISKIIYAIVKSAQKKLIAYAKEFTQYSDMGTTIVLAILVEEKKIFIYHAGDSRAYILDQENYFRQVTIDHNLKNYADRCIMSQDAFLIHALGPNKYSTEDDIQNSCQLFCVENNREFIIFLTTDGILRVMKDIDFYQFLTSHQKLEQIAEKIVDEAIRRGSADNCSVAILKYDKNKK